MAPTGLAILIGAGPATGAGIARILANPNAGNMAVALLARRSDALNDLTKSLRSETPGGVFEDFATDTSPDQLTKAFADIKAHPSFGGLKLHLAIFNIKHYSKKPFLSETYEDYTHSLDTYAGGAVQFAKLSLQRLFADHGDADLAAGSAKKGTLIFTSTLGALRCNPQFAAYGGARAAVRQLAQSLAREMSAKGVHVVHAIANGRIEDVGDADTRQGRAMAAEAVGRTYLFLHQQEPTLWTHELDMRPAQENF